MKRWTVLTPLVIALLACGSTSSVSFHGGASPSASAAATVVSPAAGGALGTPMPSPTDHPSASPSAAPTGSRTSALAMLVDLTSSKQTYTVFLVDGDGGIAQQLVGAQRTPIVAPGGVAIRLPYVSTTLSSLYYLDGDSLVHGIRINAPPPADIRLDVPAGSEAAFAVSPDDSTIAVSVLDYTVKPVHETLYTDAVGGGRRHVIFTSTSDYVWPVAWHAGLLVLAHAYGPYEESISQAAPARDDPYSAISYHLVDPANAVRKVLMGACTVSGPLSPAGSGCIQGGSIDWQGNTADWSTNDWGTRSSAASLSPDGQWMAAENPNDPSQMGIWRRSDGLMANYVNGPGLHDWAGWLDAETIIIGSEGPDWQPVVENVIAGGVVHPVAARGFFAGLFPTNVV